MLSNYVKFNAFTLYFNNHDTCQSASHGSKKSYLFKKYIIPLYF